MVVGTARIQPGRVGRFNRTMQKRHTHTRGATPPIFVRCVEKIGTDSRRSATTARNADGRTLFREVTMGIPDIGILQ